MDRPDEEWGVERMTRWGSVFVLAYPVAFTAFMWIVAWREVSMYDPPALVRLMEWMGRLLYILGLLLCVGLWVVLPIRCFASRPRRPLLLLYVAASIPLTILALLYA